MQHVTYWMCKGAYCKSNGSVWKRTIRIHILIICHLELTWPPNKLISKYSIWGILLTLSPPNRNNPELQIRGVLHVLTFSFDPLTLWCGYPKESSQWDDSFEYLHHRVCFNNKREIEGKRAEYPSLSGPLNNLKQMKLS